MDLVPARHRENLDRLAEALNLLRPRWRGGPRGHEDRRRPGSPALPRRLDSGGPRHRLGPIDIGLEPKGFEDGYPALVARSTRVRRGNLEIRVGALGDLVRSKELLRRAKDIEHLAQLYEQHPELAASSETGQAD